MSSKYEFDFDPTHTNTSHGLVVGMVPAGSRVLDVGCAAGYLGDALSVKGCTVHGIELDPVAAESARTRLASVVVADAEALDYVTEFGEDAFDVVVLADVLEHCVNPDRVLERALSVLTDTGILVVSMPNVSHGSLRLGLLQGRWNYTPLGLLDETHLRFYTWTTLRDLLAEAGFSVAEAWMTTADPLATEVEVDEEDLPEGLVEWVRNQPQALGYQFVLTAERTPPGEVAPRIEPAPAGDVAAPPTSQALLSAREEVAALRRTLARRDDELRSAKEIITVHEVRILDLLAEHQRLLTSSAWRLGSSALAPVRMVRRLVRRGNS